jgi:hypothetical protein
MLFRWTSLTSWTSSGMTLPFWQQHSVMPPECLSNILPVRHYFKNQLSLKFSMLRCCNFKPSYSSCVTGFLLLILQSQILPEKFVHVPHSYVSCHVILIRSLHLIQSHTCTWCSWQRILYWYSNGLLAILTKGFHGFPVSPGKCQSGTLKQTMTPAFHVLTYSTFIIIQSHLMLNYFRNNWVIMAHMCVLFFNIIIPINFQDLLVMFTLYQLNEVLKLIQLIINIKLSTNAVLKSTDVHWLIHHFVVPLPTFSIAMLATHEEFHHSISH